MGKFWKEFFCWHNYIVYSNNEEKTRTYRCVYCNKLKTKKRK